ncbi:MAG TPA: S53 family peptidase [Bryobacteraceae bacterium]|nr:S53 family peptidase [Bryobacteraceae bacterium]
MAEQTHRVALAGSERSARPGARAVGAPNPDEHIRISLRLRPRKPIQDLTSANEFNAALPHQRQYLSREQFAAEYGANPEDLAKVEDFAHQHNLTVAEASLPRRTVVLSGSIAALSAAFGVYLANYEHPGGAFRGRTGPIYIPADLDEVIEGVFGFDNRPQARPHFRRHKSAAAPSTALARQSGYTPLQVAQLYDFPAGGNGSGECIGILEFGGGYRTHDLTTYFKSLKITPPSVTAVSVDGVTNKPAPGQDSPDTEVMLDIEVAGAVAPGAKIVVYFSNFTEQGWVDAITTAVHDAVHKPSVLSISWGFAEGQMIWSQQAIQAVNEAFQAAAAMGVTVCCAAGDDGSRDQVDDGLAHCDFPASSAFVLACGGTTLQSSGNRITTETVWNDGPDGGATGGGISDMIPLPSWQARAHVPPSANPGGHIGRGVPDVAGDADPATGYSILADGQHGVVGGTSAVAPLWAGLIARINQKLGTPVGFLNPILYSQLTDAKVLNDITTGNNDITGQIGAYKAGPGWDACTGLGSPNGTALANALAGTSAARG